MNFVQLFNDIISNFDSFIQKMFYLPVNLVTNYPLIALGFFILVSLPVLFYVFDFLFDVVDGFDFSFNRTMNVTSFRLKRYSDRMERKKKQKQLEMINSQRAYRRNIYTTAYYNSLKYDKK